MTGAIILLITVLVVGIALFFVIRRLASVSENTIEEEYEEVSIIDMETSMESDTSNSTEDVTSQSLGTSVLVGELLYKYIQRIRNLLGSIRTRVAGFVKERQVRNQEKRLHRQRERLENHQQRLVQEKEEREKREKALEKEMLAEEVVDIDTSFLENPRNGKVPAEPIVENPVIEPLISEKPKKQTESSETDVVETFVNQIVSDEASLDTQEESYTEISDGYYYEFMEKRYISKLMKNPRDIAAYKKLGDLYIEMRNFKDAYASFEYVLKLKSDDTFAQRRLKELKAKMQD